MDNKINIREMVVEMLLEVVRTGTHSHILLKQVLDKYNYIPESDRAWIRRVFTGTIERMISIDRVIDTYSNVKAAKMKPFIRCLMRMSVYQILYMDRVPDRAAIDEAVKLAKKHKFASLAGFVNAVLRKISAEKANIDDNDHEIRYSVPKLIEDSLIKDYGNEIAEKILEESLKESHLFVRIREDISDADVKRITDEWERENIVFRNAVLSYAYELTGTEGLDRLSCFREGLYAVQDIASMMVCECAGIKKGDRVIDVCAAPGGKSLHAISKGATVEARDISAYKTGLIEENIKRMRADNISVKVWDATVFDETAEEKADILLADVPCSGLGVMSRKPDIKLNASKKTWDSLEKLQQQIVDSVWSYVKKGGIMIYSTCTLRKAENEERVRYMLENHPFKLLEEKTYYPCDDNGGFFIAKLERIDG